MSGLWTPLWLSHFDIWVYHRLCNMEFNLFLSNGMQLKTKEYPLDYFEPIVEVPLVLKKKFEGLLPHFFLIHFPVSYLALNCRLGLAWLGL